MKAASTTARAMIGETAVTQDNASAVDICREIRETAQSLIDVNTGDEWARRSLGYIVTLAGKLELHL